MITRQEGLVLVPQSAGHTLLGPIANLQVMPFRAPQPPATAPTEASD